MTQAELDALPDVTPGFGVREEIRDGKTVRVAVMQGGFGGVLWHGDDTDPVSVVDAAGQGWMIGRRSDGVLCKRRSSSY